MSADRTLVRLGDVCTLTKGAFPTEKTPPGPYPFVVTAAERKTASDFQIDGEAVCIPTISSIGHGKAALHRVHYQHGKFAVANLLVAAEVCDETVLLPKYLFLYLSALKDQLIVPLMRGTANVNLKLEDLTTVPLHLPSVAEQRRVVDLVASLDAAHSAAVTEAATGQELYEALLRHMEQSAHPVCPVADVVARVKAGGTPSRSRPELFGGDVPWLKSGEVESSCITTAEETITQKGLASSSAWVVPTPAVLVAMYGANAGQIGYLLEPMATNQAVLALLANEEHIIPRFLYHALRAAASRLRDRAAGAAQTNLSKKRVVETAITVPALTEQERIVEVMDSTIRAVEASQQHASEISRLRERILVGLIPGEATLGQDYDKALGAA